MRTTLPPKKKVLPKFAYRTKAVLICPYPPLLVHTEMISASWVDDAGRKRPPAPLEFRERLVGAKARFR